MARESHPAHSLGSDSTLHGARQSRALNKYEKAPPNQISWLFKWGLFFCDTLHYILKNQPGFFFFVTFLSQSLFDQNVAGLTSQEGSPSLNRCDQDTMRRKGHRPVSYFLWARSGACKSLQPCLGSGRFTSNAMR